MCGLWGVLFIVWCWGLIPSRETIYSPHTIRYTIILFARAFSISFFLLGKLHPSAWETAFSGGSKDTKNVEACRILVLFCCIPSSISSWTLVRRVVQIVNDSLHIPDHLEPDLADLLTGLLCKGMTLFQHQVYYLMFLHG